MGFGLALVGSWIAADEGAKAAAAAIAVGAKVVGQVPVAMAALENSALNLAQAGAQAVAKGAVAAAGTTAVTASEWQGWMDVKAAQALNTAGVNVNVGAVQEQAAQQTKEIKGVADDQQAAVDAAASSMGEAVKQANAQRMAAAQDLKNSITAKGQSAANAINNARKAVEGALVKGVIRSAFGTIDAISAAYNAIKSKFTKAPINSPVQACTETTSPAQALTQSILNEQNLLNQAKTAAAQGGPNGAKLNALIPTLNKQINASNMALLAADSYHENPAGAKNVAPGWDRLSDTDIQAMGLDPAQFSPPGSQFRAALYKSGDQYVLAYKGTTFTSEQDWENNVLQGLGLQSDYYSRAQQLAQRVYAVTGSNLQIVGHSLGGGMASAAVASINDPNVHGVTFNSAGLNQATVPDADLSNIQNQIDAYQVQGEPLTAVQQYTSKLSIAPPAVGQPQPLPAQAGDSLGDKHSMNAVEQGLTQTDAQTATQVRQLLGAGASAGS